MDRRLYYLDPQYEKVVRIDLPNGGNPKTLLDNEANLRTLNIYRKRPQPLSHPCLTNQGGCNHICIPAGDNQRTCGCSVGFQKTPGSETACQPYTSFAIVSQLQLARGFSLKDHKEAMMPISGKGMSISYSTVIYIHENFAPKLLFLRTLDDPLNLIIRPFMNNS